MRAGGEGCGGDLMDWGNADTNKTALLKVFHCQISLFQY